MTKVKIYNDPAGFQECFDMTTGNYVRTDILDNNGHNTGIDAFARTDGPMLLDIGVMGSCDAACVCPIPCYQGKRAEGSHMTMSNFERVISEGSEHGLMQVALGGAGNPDQHPCFPEMVAHCRANNVVPNYTTAGLNLNKKAVHATAEYCGAVAISWHGHGPTMAANPYTLTAIEQFTAAGCTVNIHLVVTRNNIAKVTRILTTNTWPTDTGYRELPVHAVVLLQFKPVGAGAVHDELALTPGQDDTAVHALTAAITQPHPFAVGLDACSVPMLVTSKAKIDHRLIDTCEGARFSAYVFPDMRMTPCSFDQAGRWAVSLREMTMHDAWTSPQFTDFRRHLHNACPQCPHQVLCMGGCPVLPNNVYCKSEKRLPG